MTPQNRVYKQTSSARCKNQNLMNWLLGSCNAISGLHACMHATEEHAVNHVLGILRLEQEIGKS